DGAGAEWGRVVTEESLDGQRLTTIAGRRRARTGGEVINLASTDARRRQGPPHRLGDRLRRCGRRLSRLHVGVAVPGELAVDAGAPGPGRPGALQEGHPAPPPQAAPPTPTT